MNVNKSSDYKKNRLKNINSCIFDLFVLQCIKVKTFVKEANDGRKLSDPTFKGN